jgi:predicted RNase H-like nuclease
MPGPKTYPVLGVDGCPAGWFAWRWHRTEFAHRIYPTLDAVWEANADAAAMVVDIPIGLTPGPRVCEMEAKRLLGRYNSRVFLTPPREVVKADTYPQANALSRKLTGKGISKQCWNITPKIREADRLLQDDARTRAVVRECHPEICFWALAGSPVGASKKTDEGFEERVNLLERAHQGSWAAMRAALADVPKKHAARDDVVDAMAAALTAIAIVHQPSKVRTLPENPPTDDKGIRVEMVYCIP